MWVQRIFSVYKWSISIDMGKAWENHPYSITPGNLKLIPKPCRCVELKNRRATVAPGKSKTRPVMSG